MIRYLSILTLVLLILTSPANAARAGDLVERDFTIEGQSAIYVIEFLGFSAVRNGSYKLPWKKDTSICETGNGHTELCDPTLRVNTLTFIAGKSPKVIISGNWIDADNSSLPAVPRYTFQSPDLDSDELNDWKSIHSKHNEALSSESHFVEFNTNGVPLLRITVHQFEGHTTYTLGIDERLPAARAAAEKHRNEYLEEMERKGLD